MQTCVGADVTKPFRKGVKGVKGVKRVKGGEGACSLLRPSDAAV